MTRLDRRRFLSALLALPAAATVPWVGMLGTEPHHWAGDIALCINCGATEEEVEDGLEPAFCTPRDFVRKTQWGYIGAGFGPDEIEHATSDGTLTRWTKTPTYEEAQWNA